MVTRDQALSLKVEDVLYIKGYYNSTGEPAHCKVSGAVKQWKTRSEIRVPIKRGMYEHGAITLENMHQFTLERPENVSKKEVGKLNAIFMGFKPLSFKYF